VALIPKGALGSERAAIVAVIISLVGLLVIPVVTVPAMLVAGFRWRSAPRWTRLTLVIGAALFAAYVLAIKPHPPAAQH
jgi:predicted cation transporter